MFDTIFGLPVHVLVIHAVVVFVPLCAVMAAVMAVSATWRGRLRWPFLLLLTVSVGSAFVAKLSGEALQRRLGISSPDLTRHVNLGTDAPWVVLAFWAGALLWLLADARAGRPAGPGTATRTQPGGAGTVRVLSVLAVLLAVGATTWIVLTGHAGSQAIWSGVIRSTSPR